MKKESIFTKEGFFGCDVFQSSVLEVAKKYIIAESSFCGSGDTAAFFQKKFWSSSGREKQVDRFSSTFKKEVEDFSQRLGKTGQFFGCLQKLISILSGKEKHSSWVFFSDESNGRSCLSLSLIRHSQSSRWFFSVVLLEDVIVEDWGSFQKVFFFLGKDQRTVTVTKF